MFFGAEFPSKPDDTHVVCQKFVSHATGIYSGHLVLHQHGKIGFVVAGGGFYSYHIHQGNKSDKERKIVRKKFSFINANRFNTFFKLLILFVLCRCGWSERGSNYCQHEL